MQRPLRRLRSFSVIDFGTNRKLIYDFLLVTNTNLPPILHRFQSWLIIGQTCLPLTFSLGVISCQYHYK